MKSDIIAITYWWFFLFLIGVVSWPLVWCYFNNFWDRGYAFSKIAGLAIIGWIVWILAIVRIAPFTPSTIWGGIIISGIASWFLVSKKNKKEFISWHTKNWRVILFEEALFAVCLFSWSIVRAHQPDIEGLEKFMDFGFVNSLLRSKFFPPIDMWWAGGQINYYYFGHYLSALITKLSGIEPSVTYNLSLSHLFALGMVGTFSIASNIIHLSRRNTKRIILLLCGLLAAFLVNIGGNWHTIYAFFRAYDPDKPVPPWKLEMGWNPQTYWYPNATRFIPHTIHEFPIYSYVVADLHGHVSDIPFVLLFLALLANLSYEKDTQSQKSGGREKIIATLPFGFLLGVMLMTNYWDFPIYGLTFAVTLLFLEWKQGGFMKAIKETMWRGAIVLIFSLITALGFLLNFRQIAEGIKFVNARSAVYQLAILYGWPLLLTVSFLSFIFILYRRNKQKINQADLVILAWISIGWVLVVLPEIIYVKDIYIADYHRANTMFKLVYQSFILFSVTGGYIIWRVLSEKNMISGFIKKAWTLIFIAGFSLIAIYPWSAIKSYYGELKDYKGLYGMRFLDDSKGDLAAIYWFKKNVNDQPVVLEAPGDSYTTFNRVSAMTGLPTIVGWAVHEWLWRGGYDQVSARITEVEKIYTNGSDQETKDILAKYRVKYIVIGEKEREKYSENLNEDKIVKLGKKVFEYSGTRIYQVDI